MWSASTVTTGLSLRATDATHRPAAVPARVSTGTAHTVRSFAAIRSGAAAEPVMSISHRTSGPTPKPTPHPTPAPTPTISQSHTTGILIVTERLSVVFAIVAPRIVR